MIISHFKSVEDDGFIGHITALALGSVAVAIVPKESAGDYELLIVSAVEGQTVYAGSAQKKQGSNGGYLSVSLDSPGLPRPIKAQLELKPSREGLYPLRWHR